MSTVKKINNALLSDAKLTLKMVFAVNASRFSNLLSKNSVQSIIACKLMRKDAKNVLKTTK